MADKEAKRRAWAIVNAGSDGSNKSGSGRGVPDTLSAFRHGGERAAYRYPAARSVAANKGANKSWETRRNSTKE